MNYDFSKYRDTSLVNFKQVCFFEDHLFVAYDVKTSSLKPNYTRTVGNYVTFCLCTSGTAIIQVNDHKRKMTPGAQLVIIPNTYVTLLESSSDFDCSCISVSPNFRQEGRFIYTIPLIDALLFFKEQTVMLLSEMQQDFFTKMRDLIVLCIKTTPDSYKRVLLLELVQSFFMWEQTAVATAINASPITKSPRDIMATRFLGLVNEHYRTEHRLRFYADRMFITSKYLSAIVKEVTGRTASQWIDIFLIGESQNLLSTTTMSIAEISDALGFPNQSFFGKFFKHHTGKGPLAYRLRKNDSHK